MRLIPSATGPDLDVLAQARAAGRCEVLAVVLPRYANDALGFLDRARDR